jgi:Protein of unknown function (DUF3240)
MKHLDVCLKLVLPSALNDQILDQLLKHPEWAGPFITHRVEGHGDPESIASVAEQVRGCAERVQIEILMNSAHVPDLLSQLRAGLSSAEVVWWLSPVRETGNLA